MCKKIMAMVALLFCGTALIASDYMNEIRSFSDRSKSFFRIQKSDGATQFLDKVCLPLTSAWIATTTPVVMRTAAGAGCPALSILNASYSTKLNFPDGGTTLSGTMYYSAPVVWALTVPENFVTGCDCQLRVVASSASNVSSDAFLLTRFSKNNGNLTNIGSSATNVSDGAYTEYVIDLSSLTGISTLAPGDVLNIAIGRGEKVTTAATSTIWMKGSLNFEYNKNIDFSW